MAEPYCCREEDLCCPVCGKEPDIGRKSKYPFFELRCSEPPDPRLAELVRAAVVWSGGKDGTTELMRAVRGLGDDILSACGVEVKRG